MVLQFPCCSNTATPQGGVDALMDSSLPALSDLAFAFEFDARVFLQKAAARVLDDPTERRSDLELARELADVAHFQPSFAELHVEGHVCSTFEEDESWWELMSHRFSSQPNESAKPDNTKRHIAPKRA